MMNRSGIETYELLRLDEVALAGYFDLEDTRFEEWYEKNRAVGDRLYSAILDRKIDLVAFRGTEDGRRRFRCLTVHGTGNPRCRWIQDATRSEFQSRQMQGRSSTARR